MTYHCIIIRKDKLTPSYFFSVEATFINPTIHIGSVHGYVVVKYQGEYGSVCDDSFEDDDNGANVLCRMMNYFAGVYDEGLYKTGNDDSIGNKVRTELRTWLTNVKCNGDELLIQDCTHNQWGIHSCDKTQDVGIKCFGKLDPDLYVSIKDHTLTICLFR